MDRHTIRKRAGWPAQPTPADRLGSTVLGSFRLVEFLGEGPFAMAFLAEQLGTDRRVVVKLTHEHLFAGPDDAAEKSRTEDRLRALTRVRHPNLVKVYLAGETDDGLPAVAMEHVGGNTLREMLDVTVGPMSIELLRPVFLQIGAALRTLHSQGVAHQGIAPSNIAISIDVAGVAQATLLDLGIASPWGDDPGEPTVESTLASDIYALGAILWRAVTGEERGQDAMATARQPPGTRPDSNLAFIERMLSADPTERPTADEFVDNWPRLAHELGSARETPPLRLASAPSTPTSNEDEPLPPPPDPATRASGQSAFDLETIDRLISTSPTGEMRRVDDDPAPRGSEDPLRVVLVDDDAFTRRFLESYLLRQNVEVVPTANLEVDPPDLHGVRVALISGHMTNPSPGTVIDRLRRRRASLEVIVTARSDIGDEWRSWGAREFVSITANLGRVGELLGQICSELRRPMAEAVNGTAMLELANADPQLVVETIEHFIGQFPEWHAALEASISKGDCNGARSACEQIESAVMILGADTLGHQASVVRTLIDEGEIAVVGGFVERMEAEYATAFRELMNVRAQIQLT